MPEMWRKRRAVQRRVKKFVPMQALRISGIGYGGNRDGENATTAAQMVLGDVLDEQ
jgi:hypothetical protein